MTPKQKRFVAEYLIDLNATQAAVRAGFSKKNADKIGSQLLGKTRVKAAIAEKTEKRMQKLEITAEKVLNELALMGFANMFDYVQITPGGEAYVDLSKITREQAAAIQEITVDETGGGAGDNKREAVQRTRFKLASKRDSLELLGKHLKLFTDKHEIAGQDGGPIVASVEVSFVKPEAQS